MRSLRIGAKCDTAVNTNIVASAARAHDSHVAKKSTPAKPRARKTASAPKRTMSIVIPSNATST